MKKRQTKPLVLLLTVAMISSMTACGPRNASNGSGDVIEDWGPYTSASPEPGIVTPESGDPEGKEPGKGTQKADLAAGVDGWQQFMEKTFYEVLSDAGEDNQIYSPANLYLCLAMLSEMSKGDTRAQITALLGQEEQEVIRKQAGKLYRKISYMEKCRKGLKCYVGEEKTNRHEDNSLGHKCIIGNSLWLNEKIPFRKEVMDRMEESYFAECSKGKMGTAAMDKEIQDWVNGMTGGDLQEQVKSIRTNPNMMILLISSINFQAQWKTQFSEERIKEGIFHGTAGSAANGESSGKESEGDVVCDFLRQTIDTEVVKTGQYMAAELPMQDGIGMHIILPDKGVSVAEILEKEKGRDLLALCTGRNKKAEHVCVDFSMPKFLIDSTIELEDILKAMAVDDIFDATKADFSPLLRTEGDGETGIYVGKASQTSSMEVNEDGCSVASYTEMSLECKGVMPEEKYKMHCNRPFLFVITDKDDVPLFTGIVQDLSSGRYSKILID